MRQGQSQKPSKPSQAAAHGHPQGLGETRPGGATSRGFRVTAGRCPPWGNVRVFMLWGGSSAPPAHLERGCWGPQCPVCPIPCWASPRAHSAVWGQPWLSQEGPDPWPRVQGLCQGQLGTGGGSLAMPQGSQAPAPSGDSLCHHGQEQGDIRTPPGMPQSSDRLMDCP